MTLSAFDLESLIGKLNETLDSDETPLTMGEFRSTSNRFGNRLNPLKKWADMFYDMKVTSEGEIPIYQKPDIAMLHPFNQEGRIGHFAIETGEIGSSSCYAGIYETVNMVLKRPLNLTNGEIIPRCNIMVHYEVDEGFNSRSERSDRHLIGTDRFKELNLYDVLPTEWFMTRGRISA